MEVTGSGLRSQGGLEVMGVRMEVVVVIMEVTGSGWRLGWRSPRGQDGERRLPPPLRRLKRGLELEGSSVRKNVALEPLDRVTFSPKKLRCTSCSSPSEASGVDAGFSSSLPPE